MGAGGDLGHDAAIGPMRRLLARQPVREDAPVGSHQRRRGLVAARFDAEDQAHRGLPCHLEQRLAQARYVPPPSHRHSRLAAGARPGSDGGRGAAGGARLERGGDRDRPDRHQRRRDPGPPARRGGRQGAVDQGAGPLPGRGPHRHVGPFDEGRRDDPAGGAGDRGDARAGRHARPADRRRRASRRCRSGARVGTSSPRRAAQLLAGGPTSTSRRSAATSRPGWPRSPVGEFDATLLAAAGLDRLGIRDGAPLDLLPAPAQGAIGVEILAARDDLRAVLAADRPPAYPRGGRRRARLPRRARAATAIRPSPRWRRDGAGERRDPQRRRPRNRMRATGAPADAGARPARPGQPQPARDVRPMKILVLRPQPGAGETAARARALGLEPIVAPLFTVRPLAWTAARSGRFRRGDADQRQRRAPGRRRLDAIQGAALLCGRRDATAAAASEAGFADVRVGPDDGAALLLAMAEGGVRRAFHPCGRGPSRARSPGDRDRPGAGLCGRRRRSACRSAPKPRSARARSPCSTRRAPRPCSRRCAGDRSRVVDRRDQRAHGRALRAGLAVGRGRATARATTPCWSLPPSCARRLGTNKVRKRDERRLRPHRQRPAATAAAAARAGRAGPRLPARARRDGLSARRTGTRARGCSASRRRRRPRRMPPRRRRRPSTRSRRSSPSRRPRRRLPPPATPISPAALAALEQRLRPARHPVARRRRQCRPGRGAAGRLRRAARDRPRRRFGLSSRRCFAQRFGGDPAAGGGHDHHRPRASRSRSSSCRASSRRLGPQLIGGRPRPELVGRVPQRDRQPGHHPPRRYAIGRAEPSGSPAPNAGSKSGEVDVAPGRGASACRATTMARDWMLQGAPLRRSRAGRSTRSRPPPCSSRARRRRKPAPPRNPKGRRRGSRPGRNPPVLNPRGRGRPERSRSPSVRLDLDQGVGPALRGLDHHLRAIEDRSAARRPAPIGAAMGVAVDDRRDIVEAVDRVGEPRAAEERDRFRAARRRPSRPPAHNGARRRCARSSASGARFRACAPRRARRRRRP